MGRPRSPESSSSRTTKGSKKHSSHREKHRGPEIYYTEPLTYQQQQPLPQMPQMGMPMPQPYMNMNMPPQPLPQMPQMGMPMPQPNMNMNMPPQPSQVYLSSSSSSSSSFEIIDISRTFPANRSGIKTFFTTPSEHKQRRRLRRRSSSKRLFKFGNSSSSSVNSDLAYGTGYLKRPKRKGVRSRKGKEIDREDARYRYSDREGRARGSDREEGKRRSRGSTNAEILAVGAGLAALAREQNKADLKAARNGKGPEVVAVKETHRFDGSTSRGLGNSKISHGSDTFDEDGWESASDDESDGSVDSRLAFGGSGFFGSTRHKPLSRKNTIVDPRLFGPENSLRPYVDEPVGFGQVTWSSTDDFGQQYRTDSVTVGPNESFSGSQSQVSLQQVFPQPTSDPSRFDAVRNSAASGTEPVYRARPDPVPIQQPQPYTPVSQSIYEPTYPTAPSEKRTPASGRSTSVAQAALVGVAGAAVGAAIASSRKDEKRQRDDEREEERRREDERRRRREIEEERLKEEDRLRRRESEKRESKDDRRREKRESPDRDDHKERHRDKDRKDESRGSSDEKRKEKKREKRREDSRDETRDEKREKRREDRREERRSERSEVAPRVDPRYEERRTKSEAAVSTVSSIDPFMFQVKEDAFPTPTAESSQGHRRIESVPKVVTVEREPDYARKRSSSIKDKPTSSKPDYFDEYAQHDDRDRDRYRERDREMHDAEAIARETEHSTAPIAAAAIGAAVAVVTASSMRESKSEKRRAERRNGRSSDYDDRDREYESRGREPVKAQERDPIDQKIQEDADRAYREIVMARKIASQIRSRSNSPDGSIVDKYEHRDDEEEIVRIDTPPELKHEKEKMKGPYDAPNADFHPDYEFEHPKHVENFSLPAIGYDRSNPDMGFLKRDPDADRPRPLLNLVRPTPVPSPLPERQVSRSESTRSDPTRSESGRSESARSEPARKSRDRDEPPRTSASDVVIGPRGNVVASPTASTVSKAVTWGENETKHFDVESPSDHRDEYISSSDIPEPPKRETKATGSKGWGAIVAGVVGAGVGAAAASSSDSSKKSKGKENEKSKDVPYEYRGVIVEPESPPPSQRRRRSPPSPGPKPTISQSSPPSHMPGSFGDDLDFTAIVAAGLQDSGFDPDIVINDTKFHRRDSPPGSNNLGGYQAPFAETVSDLGQIPVNPSVMSGASQGFIMGEVDATQKDWRSVSPDLEETPTKLSKKEQKKRDKEAKRRSVDSTPLESSPTPKEDIPEPEPYFEPKLSKKEQKKRDKEAKRQSSLAEDITPIVEPTVSREIVEEPESYFEPAKKSKKKSKRDSAAFDDNVDVSSPGTPHDSRTVSIPVDAFADLRNEEDEWNEPKKSKKKSKRDSERFDSPVRSAPPPEIIERERSSSRKSKRDSEILDSPSRSAHPSEIVDRDRSPSRKSHDKYRDSDRYERDPRDVSLPPSTPSETSRDGDYDESRKSRKSSMRDTSIFDARDRGDSRSVVSEAASRYDDEPRKSKKKSRSSTRDDDDTRSVASAPAGDEESRRSKKKEKEKEKKGGFFGLFGSKSDVGAREESPKESKDDFEDVKKKKKSKRSSMPDASSLYGDLGSVSVGDLSRSVSNGHSSRRHADDLDDGVRSDGERERKKSRSRAGSSSSKKDSFLGNAGTLGAGVGLAGAAVAIAAQQHQQEKATAEAYEEASLLQDRRERRDRSSRRANVFDYEIMEREIRPSIDPQYGDLLPLPPSEPDTDIESLDDLPGLPESRPTTPEAERLAREKARSSMRRSLQETPVKSPSQSAIPLKFIMGSRSDRSGPSSPGLPRSSPMQSPIVPDSQSSMFPRTRQNRPKSFESKEYRPLYLVESSRGGLNVRVDDDSQLPALPLSQASSRSSSQLEFEGLSKIRDHKEPLSIDTEHVSEEHHSGLLDSQQSTPKAAIFPRDIILDEEPESTDAFSISKKSTSRRSSPAPEKEKKSSSDVAAMAISGVALATTLGMLASSAQEHSTKDSDALTSTEQQPAPVEPMTKDRSSYLLQSSPMSRQDDLGSEDRSEVSPSRRKPSRADVDALHSIEEREVGDLEQERERALEDLSGEQHDDATEPADEFSLPKSKKDKKKDKKKGKGLSRSSTQEDFNIPEASSEAVPELPIVVAPEAEEDFSVPKSKKDKKKDKKKGKSTSSWEFEEEEKPFESAEETIREFPESSSAPAEIGPFGETTSSKKGKKKDKKGKSKAIWEPEEESVPQTPEESLPETSPEIVEEPSMLAEPEPLQDVPTSKKSKKKDKKGKSKTSWEPEEDTAPQESESPVPEPLETSREIVGAESAPIEPEIVEDFTPAKSKKDRKKDKKKGQSPESFEPELQDSSRDLEDISSETQNLSQDPASELATPAEPEIPDDQFFTKSKKDKKKDKKKGKFAASFEPEEEPAHSAPAHPEEEIIPDDFATPETKKSKKQKRKSGITWQPEEESFPIEEAQPEILDEVEQPVQEATAPVDDFVGFESKKSKKKKGKKGLSWEPEPEPEPVLPRDVPSVQIAEPTPAEAEATPLAAETPGSDIEDAFHDAEEEHAAIVEPPAPEEHSFQESKKSKKKKGKGSATWEPEPEQEEASALIPKETEDIPESEFVMPGTKKGKKKGKKFQSFTPEELFTSEQISENFEDSVETIPAEEAVNTALDVEPEQSVTANSKKGKKKGKKSQAWSDEPEPSQADIADAERGAIEPESLDATAFPETLDEFTMPSSKKGKKKGKKSQAWMDEPEPEQIDAADRELTVEPESADATPIAETLDEFTLPSSKKGKKKGKKSQAWLDELGPEQAIAPETAPAIEEAAPATETPDEFTMPSSKKGKKKNRKSQAFDFEETPNDSAALPEAKIGDVAHISEGKEGFPSASTIIPAVALTAGAAILTEHEFGKRSSSKDRSEAQADEKSLDLDTKPTPDGFATGYKEDQLELARQLKEEFGTSKKGKKDKKKRQSLPGTPNPETSRSRTIEDEFQPPTRSLSAGPATERDGLAVGYKEDQLELARQLKAEFERGSSKKSKKDKKKRSESVGPSAWDDAPIDSYQEESTPREIADDVPKADDVVETPKGDGFAAGYQEDQLSLARQLQAEFGSGSKKSKKDKKRRSTSQTPRDEEPREDYFDISQPVISDEPAHVDSGVAPDPNINRDGLAAGYKEDQLELARQLKEEFGAGSKKSKKDKKRRSTSQTPLAEESRADYFDESQSFAAEEPQPESAPQVAEPGTERAPDGLASGYKEDQLELARQLKEEFSRKGKKDKKGKKRESLSRTRAEDDFSSDLPSQEQELAEVGEASFDIPVTAEAEEEFAPVGKKSKKDKKGKKRESLLRTTTDDNFPSDAPLPDDAQDREIEPEVSTSQPEPEIVEADFAPIGKKSKKDKKGKKRESLLRSTTDETFSDASELEAIQAAEPELPVAQVDEFALIAEPEEDFGFSTGKSRKDKKQKRESLLQSTIEDTPEVSQFDIIQEPEAGPAIATPSLEEPVPEVHEAAPEDEFAFVPKKSKKDKKNKKRESLLQDTVAETPETSQPDFMEERDVEPEIATPSVEEAAPALSEAVAEDEFAFTPKKGKKDKKSKKRESLLRSITDDAPEASTSEPIQEQEIESGISTPHPDEAIPENAEDDFGFVSKKSKKDKKSKKRESLLRSTTDDDNLPIADRDAPRDTTDAQPGEKQDDSTLIVELSLGSEPTLTTEEPLSEVVDDFEFTTKKSKKDKKGKKRESLLPSTTEDSLAAEGISDDIEKVQDVESHDINSAKIDDASAFETKDEGPAPETQTPQDDSEFTLKRTNSKKDKKAKKRESLLHNTTKEILPVNAASSAEVQQTRELDVFQQPEVAQEPAIPEPEAEFEEFSTKKSKKDKKGKKRASLLPDAALADQSSTPTSEPSRDVDTPVQKAATESRDVITDSPSETAVTETQPIEHPQESPSEPAIEEAKEEFEFSLKKSKKDKKGKKRESLVPAPLDDEILSGGASKAVDDLEKSRDVAQDETTATTTELAPTVFDDEFSFPAKKSKKEKKGKKRESSVFSPEEPTSESTTKEAIKPDEPEVATVEESAPILSEQTETPAEDDFAFPTKKSKKDKKGKKRESSVPAAEELPFESTSNVIDATKNFDTPVDDPISAPHEPIPTPVDDDFFTMKKGKKDKKGKKREHSIPPTETPLESTTNVMNEPETSESIQVDNPTPVFDKPESAAADDDFFPSKKDKKSKKRGSLVPTSEPEPIPESSSRELDISEKAEVLPSDNIAFNDPPVLPEDEFVYSSKKSKNDKKRQSLITQDDVAAPEDLEATLPPTPADEDLSSVYATPLEPAPEVTDNFGFTSSKKSKKDKKKRQSLMAQDDVPVEEDLGRASPSTPTEEELSSVYATPLEPATSTTDDFFTSSKKSKKDKKKRGSLLRSSTFDESPGEPSTSHQEAVEQVTEPPAVDVADDGFEVPSKKSKKDKKKRQSVQEEYSVPPGIPHDQEISIAEPVVTQESARAIQEPAPIIPESEISRDAEIDNQPSKEEATSIESLEEKPKEAEDYGFEEFTSTKKSKKDKKKGKASSKFDSAEASGISTPLETFTEPDLELTEPLQPTEKIPSESLAAKEAPPAATPLDIEGTGVWDSFDTKSKKDKKKRKGLPIDSGEPSGVSTPAETAQETFPQIIPEPALIETTESSVIVDDTRNLPLEVETPTEKAVQEPEQDEWAILTKKSKKDKKKRQSGLSAPIDVSEELKPFDDSTTIKETDLISPPAISEEPVAIEDTTRNEPEPALEPVDEEWSSGKKSKKDKKKRKSGLSTPFEELPDQTKEIEPADSSSSTSRDLVEPIVGDSTVPVVIEEASQEPALDDWAPITKKSKKDKKKSKSGYATPIESLPEPGKSVEESAPITSTIIEKELVEEPVQLDEQPSVDVQEPVQEAIVEDDWAPISKKSKKDKKHRKSGVSTPLEDITESSKSVDPPFEEPIPEPVPFQPSEDVIGRSFEPEDAPQEPSTAEWALPSSKKSKKDKKKGKSGLSTPAEEVSEPVALAEEPIDKDIPTPSSDDVIEKSLPWSEPAQEPAEDKWAPISSKKSKKDKKKRKSGFSTPLEDVPEASVPVEEPVPASPSEIVVEEFTSTETPIEDDWAAIPSKKSKKDKKKAKSGISTPAEEFSERSIGIEGTIEQPASSLPSDPLISDKPVEDDWAPIPSKKSKKDKKRKSSTSTPIEELADVAGPSDEGLPKSEPNILPEVVSHEPLIVEESQAPSHETPYNPLESEENSTALPPILGTSGDASAKHIKDKSTVESSSREFAQEPIELKEAPVAHPPAPIIEEQADLASEKPVSHESVQEVPETSFKNIVTAKEVETISAAPTVVELAQEPLEDPIEDFGSYSIKKSKKDKKKRKSGLSTPAEDIVAPQYDTVDKFREIVEEPPIVGEPSFFPSTKDIITPLTLDEQLESTKEIAQEPEDEWATPSSKKSKKDKKKQKSGASTPKELPNEEATVGGPSAFQQADKTILEESAQPIYAEPAEIEIANKEPIVEVVEGKELEAFDDGFGFSSKKAKKDKKGKKASRGASISEVKEVSPKTSILPVESGNVDRAILGGEERKGEVESSFMDKGGDVEIEESEGFYGGISRKGSKKDKRKRQATTDANAAEGIESKAPVTSWADEVEEAEVERKLPVIELIDKDDSLAHIAKTTESSPVDDFVRPMKKGKKGKKRQSGPMESPSLAGSSSSPTKDEVPKDTEKTTAAVALGAGAVLAGAALLSRSDDKKDEPASSSKAEERPTPTRKLSKKEKRKMSIDKRTPTNDIFDDDVLWEGKDPKEFQEKETQDDDGDDGFGFWSEPKEETPQGKEILTEEPIQHHEPVQTREPTLQAQIPPVTTMPRGGPISPPQSPDFMQHTTQPSSSGPPDLFANQPQIHVAPVQQTPPATRQHTSSPTHDNLLQTDRSPDLAESPIDRNLFRSSSRFGTRGFSDLPVVEEEEPPVQSEPLSRPRDFEDINRDSAFVAESPVPKQGAFANNHEHVRDSGVHLRDNSPPEHVSAPVSSSDAAIARLSWPSVDEQSETVDLHRSQRPKVETPVKRHREDKSERRGSPIPTEQVNEFFRAQRSHDTPSKSHRDVSSIDTLPSQKEREAHTDLHRSATIYQSSHKHHDEGPAARDLLPKKRLKEDLPVERQSPIVHKLTEERPVLRHVERTPKAIPSSQRSDESSRDLPRTETLGGHSSQTNKASLVKQRLAKFESPEVHQSVRPRDVSSTIKQDVKRPQTPEQSSRPKKQESYSELKESQRPQAERPKPLDGNAVAAGVALAGAAGLGFAAARQLSQEKRPSSAASQRSISNINRLRTPDPKMAVRPESVNSNRSGTPPLRRTDRKISGDLRSLSQRSQVDLAKEAELAAITSAAAVNTPPVSTANPTANEGRVRSKDMADVYDGFGEGRMGSPRSPTRPHSMRRRQSMQVLDLESKVEQLAAENRMLAEAKAQAERTLHSSQQNPSALVERDAEIDALKRTLDWLQNEVTRLTEVNEGLTSANVTLGNQQNERYKMLETEHANTARELQETRDAHTNLSSGMEGIVVAQVRTAVQEKDQEIAQLRAQLESAKEKIREMQRQILASKANDIDFLTVRDEDYFDNACQQLCQHVQQWVLRFSKFSDMRACRLTSEINNDKTIDRLDNAILDGADVDGYLSDRVKRRDVFMSMTMTMIWEFIFTRYLFGMDREQRQKLKSLEKLLSEVGPAAAVHQWRATTLTLLSKRTAFVQQREQDTEAVVHAIMETLSEILPPPSNLEAQIEEQLKRVVNAAVNLSIEMRTQRAGYMMLPPLQPEYDANGDLASKVSFNAALMNERSGDTTSNEELEANDAVVRIVLFPLVVKKGDDRGEGDEEIVVCPAQVLVAKPKKSVRLVGPDDMAHPNTSRMSMQSSMPADYGASPRASRGSVV